MHLSLNHGRHPYHFVSENRVEQFERIAISVYLDAARTAVLFPVMSREHFFKDDTYGVAEALYDFANDLFCEKLEQNQVYPGTMKEWDDDIWEEVEIDLFESLGYLEAALLDDLYEHWNRNQLVFIDEHRTMQEELNVMHCNLQEVW